ncbi:hypothetical protein H1R20_g15712, partial [Candolleomyces eurysporus]
MASSSSTAPTTTLTSTVSLADLAKELGKLAGQRVKHDEDRRTDATQTEDNSTFTIEALTVLTQEPLSIPKGIFELRLPSINYTEIYKFIIPEFDTLEGNLKHHLGTVFGFLGRTILLLAGISRDEAKFWIDLSKAAQNSRADLACMLELSGQTICIGSVELKTPATVKQDQFRTMDSDIHGETPGNESARDRVLKRRYDFLQFCKNQCASSPSNKTQGVIKVTDYINSPDEWVAFYKGAIVFLVVGFIKNSPLFAERFGEICQQNELEAEFETLFTMVEEYFG